MPILAPEVTYKKAASSFEPRAYRINDACQILQISRSHIYELISRGEIRLIKIGGRSLISATEIQRLLNGGVQQ
jgi:excisionase family DNA binding protein